MRLVAIALGSVLLAALVPAVVRGSSASTPQAAWPRCSDPVGVFDGRAKLGLSVCGPTKVFRNVNYSYTVVLKDIKTTTFRTVRLSVIHYDPIRRASRPYRRAGTWAHDPAMSVAVFPTLTNFRPGDTFRVSFTLPFKQHRDPKGSNFMVEVQAFGPRARTDRTYDVWWKQRPPG